MGYFLAAMGVLEVFRTKKKKSWLGQHNADWRTEITIYLLKIKEIQSS